MSPLRSEATLPGHTVWGTQAADATSRLDVAAAAACTAKAIAVVASLLEKQIAVVGQPSVVVTVAGIFDPAALGAFQRLWQRCKLLGIDFWHLLWRGTATDWELCMTNSFAAGASLHLEESTIIQQLVQEFRVALCVGRKLMFRTGSADVEVNIRRTFQCLDASGSLFDMEVDLLWPGEARSVVRVTQAFWDAKGGKPRTQEAKLAHAAAKASNRAMPTRFTTNLLTLYFWQERLLNAVVEIDRQMLANKAAGKTNWHHPGSLCSGGRYANGSACLRAVQSARGMLACAWHIATGGRQAELFRCRATDTCIDGVCQDSKPPVWALGLAGADVLAAFQQAQGTGFGMINWHAKGIYDYGAPDYMPFWPPCMSGICLGAIINLAFVVTSILQPTSPARPIIQQKPNKAIYNPSSTTEPRLTINNVQGFFYPYGELKHLPALDDPVAPAVATSAMAKNVNAAISSAAFLDDCWTGLRAAGTSPPPDDDAAAVKYNNPSLYSKRYTLAGEAFMMKEQLEARLPPDFWKFYMVIAGRSAASNSAATYIRGYQGAHGNRLPYVLEGCQSYAPVTFRPSMLSWSPAKANGDVRSSLSETQRASLQQAEELGQRYAANPATPAIWEHLIGLVKQEGSFAGMLRLVSGPLLHQYELPAFTAGPDLAWLRMTPAAAQANLESLLGSINAANAVLFGQLPDPPAKLVLLQNTVDLLCCDVDSVKLSLASPTARADASITSAQAAVRSALQSAAAVAVLTARGDNVAASQAAAAAARAAQAAVGHAQQLQLVVSSDQLAREPSSSAAAAAPDDGCVADLPDLLVEPATAAAMTLRCPSVMPAGSPAAVLQQGSAAADTGLTRAVSSTPSLQLAAANAHLAAQLAHGPQPALLPRGSGLLLLFSNDWAGKARLLEAGKATVGAHTFSHFSVAQLMSKEGLLLRDGLAESSVPVRVAAEFLAQEQQQLTGNWSNAVFKLSVTPGVNLLLHSRATHTWGKKFTAKSSAAAGYEALFNPDLSQANMVAALGHLQYETHRPLRSCVQRSTAAASSSQQPPPDAAAAAGQAGNTAAAAAAAGDSQELLRQARRAVNELAMSLDGSEADACFAVARSAVVPLLRHADSSCASSAKALLLGVYDAVHAASELPAGAREQLLSLLSEAAAVFCGAGSEPNSSCTPFGTAAAAAAAGSGAGAGCSQPSGHSAPSPGTSAGVVAPAPLSAPMQHTTPRASGSKRHAAASSDSPTSKKLKVLLDLDSPAPVDADGRPGCYAPGGGGFYLQEQDIIFVEVVRNKETLRDPCTFFAESSSSSSSERLVWMFRLESFTRTTFCGRFYFSEQRCLRGPLEFQGRAQQWLDVVWLQGVFHTMHPGPVMARLTDEDLADVAKALSLEVDAGGSG